MKSNFFTRFVPSQAAALVVAALAAGLLLAQTAAAQSAAARPPMGKPVPAEFLDQLAGTWGDTENQSPPGFPPYDQLKPFRTFGEKVVAPILQPWAAARKAATVFEIEEVGNFCRPTGILMGHQNRGGQIVANKDHILTIGSSIHNRGIRRIYLNRGHLKNPPLTAYGDSVAYWDGERMIVDVIGFDDKTVLDLDGGRHSTEMHILEKWRFVADGQWLERVYIVDDPRAFKAPFTFTRYHKRLPVETRLREVVCLDEPDSWRGWVWLRNEAVKALDEQRAAAAKALKSSPKSNN